MAHNKHTEDSSILELSGRTRDDYLEMTKDWKDPLGPLVIKEHINQVTRVAVDVVREDVHEMGTKGRWADLLIMTTQADTLVYVAPRVGYAGMSLAWLAKKYGKRLILFCPSSKQISNHQAVCASYGAELRFVRIAAMPNLNRIAKAFADENGFEFLPFGLKHPLVTAVGVRTVEDNFGPKAYRDYHLWTVISTGVLVRALQIGFHNKINTNVVAVARNIKAGEKGAARITSHPYDFHKNEDEKFLPPFPTVASYDAKAWRYIEQWKAKPLFWNVAKEPLITETALRAQVEINSARDWGDERDLGKPEQDINGWE